MRDITSGVEYLHGLFPPIVHRDIKPENILVFHNKKKFAEDPSKKLKLADFGSANLKTKILKETICGTPEYFSPEMINKSGHDQKVDIWSLGILAYELFHKKTPFCLNSTHFKNEKNECTRMLDKLTENILVNFFDPE